MEGRALSRPTLNNGTPRRASLQLMRRRSGLRQIDPAHDRDHQDPADDSERRHEIKITAPAFIEKHTEKIAGETAAEILERIDQAGSEAGHLRAAHIHRRGGAEDRMSSVRGEGDEDQKNNRGRGGAELCGEENDRSLEKVE